MNLEEMTEKSKKLTISYWKGTAYLYVIGIAFSIMAGIYLYVYSITNFEIVIILLAVGVITSNIKDRIELVQKGYSIGLKEKVDSDAIRVKKKKI